MENQIQQEEIEIDIREVVYLIRAHLILIITVGILSAILTGAVTKYFITPQYTSTSKLYIAGKSAVVSSLADLQLGSQLTKDYAELVQSRPVVEEVISGLHLDMEYNELLGDTSISNPTDTRILVISVEQSDPEMAKKIADKFAKITAKQISDIMDVSEPKIVEEGVIEEYPSSPNLKRNIVLGGLAGIFLTIMILVVRFIMDDNIKTTEDVEKYLELTTLGMIPMGEEEYDGAKKQFWKRKRRQG